MGNQKIDKTIDWAKTALAMYHDERGDQFDYLGSASYKQMDCWVWQKAFTAWLVIIGYNHNTRKWYFANYYDNDMVQLSRRTSIEQLTEMLATAPAHFDAVSWKLDGKKAIYRLYSEIDKAIVNDINRRIEHYELLISNLKGDRRQYNQSSKRYFKASEDINYV